MLEEYLDFDRQTLIITAAVFVLFAFGGFYLASSTGGGSDKTFVSSMNVTVDSEIDIATARFDGKALNLMHEDSKKARFYLDLDRDGSFDLELEGLKHDGQGRKYNRTVTLGNTNYRLHFQYRDDARKEGDSWLTLYRVLEVR